MTARNDNLEEDVDSKAQAQTLAVIGLGKLGAPMVACSKRP